VLIKNKDIFVGVAMGLVAALIWGSWPVISNLAQIQNVTSVEIAILRFGISGLVLLPVLFYHSVPLRLLCTKGCVLAIGAGLPYALLAMKGMTLSSSAHFGIITPSCMLVFSTLGSVYLLSERLTRQRIVGILIIILGVLFVGLSNLGDMNMQVVLGDLMFIGCGALWASFTVFSKYWGINAWVATAMVSVVSGVVCLPFYVVDHASLFANLSLSYILIQGAFQGILVAIFALYSYSKSVSLLGAAKGAVFAALVPPFALCLGVFILNEVVTWVEVVGIACVVLGMLFALGLIQLPYKKRLSVGV
jgi:drug/metabolite transporter (DMT)-like permease